MAKVALITGALGGIGTALCETFVGAGYWVIGTDRRLGETCCHAFMQMDVRDLSLKPRLREIHLKELKELIAEDGLKVLINNAAIQLLNRTDNVTVAEWDETLETNLVAPFLLIQGLLPELERARGSVVNVASIHAVATKPGFVAYATSKAALVGMTRALAVDLGPRVRVNAVNPAATATPMLRSGFESEPEKFAELSRMHPMERIAEPSEVARTALFLASDETAFITGACLHIDGGIGARLHDPV